MPESTIPSLSSDQLGCFRYLAKMFSDAQIRAEERTKYTHERFNVFTTLLSAHDEVRLHTRFLHCLLNPNGLHDCGALFLNLFFKTLAELPATNHLGERVTFQLPSSSATWTVEKEASRRRAGQIDLLLERTNFAIAIENKIYALEQPNQLARYSGYLRQHYGDAFKVIYLTRDGRASTTHNGCCNYIRISYAEHILAWLEQCLRETYSMPRINQVVVQYRDVVRAIALGKR